MVAITLTFCLKLRKSSPFFSVRVVDVLCNTCDPWYTGIYAPGWFLEDRYIGGITEVPSMSRSWKQTSSRGETSSAEPEKLIPRGKPSKPLASLQSMAY